MSIVVFLVAVLVTPTVTQAQCRAGTFQEQKTRYRCVTDTYATITEIPEHLCTHVCMQKDCSVINYNHEKRYCQLSTGVCKEMVVDPEFRVTYKQCTSAVTMSPCIQWVPVAKVVVDKYVECQANKTWRVGRLVLSGDILVGKIRSQYTYVWKDGSIYKNVAETEVLQLQPGCTATWIPYTPGDPLPSGTVVGGYLGDPCYGTPVIRGLVANNTYRCGYYNAETRLGYTVFYDPEVVTEMDILVLG